MNTRRIAALAFGGIVIAAAVLLVPIRAAASGSIAPGEVVAGDFLAGYDTGLYRVAADGSRADPLWLDGEVRKIISSKSGWYFLTSKGVLFSADLVAFQDRSAGLPIKTYKLVSGGAKAFTRETQDLKDLEVDPLLADRVLTCTKDEVFLSEDGGKSWKNLGMPVVTTGLKAVSFGPYPGGAEQGIWASHPVKGLFVRKLAGNTAWIPASGGLDLIQGSTSVEEVADLLCAPPLPPEASPAAPPAAPPLAKATPAASPAAALPFWASGSFLPRLYRWEALSRNFKQVYDAGGDFGTIESLASLPDGSLRFVSQGGVKRFDPKTGKVGEDLAGGRAVRIAVGAKPDRQLLSLSFPEKLEGNATVESGLSELWLVTFVDRKPWRARAENHQTLYLQTGFVVHPDSRSKYFGFMEAKRLDGLVIDMKDDNGRLRFDPRNPLLQKIGRVTSPLDIETFVKEAKVRGFYLIARIPVFKDQVLFSSGGGKYAVWDSASKAPWQGYRMVKSAPAAAAATGAATGAAPLATPQVVQPIPLRFKDLGVQGPGSVTATPSARPMAPPLAPPMAQAPPPLAMPVPVAPTLEKELIQEYWVDPYSEDVWAYNVAIANEIIGRGFDEVQFDYIRFPTDGDNIDLASYRWRDPGMDKESALASFLRYARESIAAPISVDIYGANGWFRSGVRTGQDVEMIARYADVICPMYYPSHFEQTFLAQPPAAERPYRIYRIGGLHTELIARKRIAVRPYVQAFYLNVSYDRAYYNVDYVSREVAGVRDAVNLGMTFWNNGGRYDDVPVLDKDDKGRLSRPADSGLLD